MAAHPLFGRLFGLDQRLSSAPTLYADGVFRTDQKLGPRVDNIYQPRKRLLSVQNAREQSFLNSAVQRIQLTLENSPRGELFQTSGRT